VIGSVLHLPEGLTRPAGKHDEESQHYEKRSNNYDLDRCTSSLGRSAMSHLMSSVMNISMGSRDVRATVIGKNGTMRGRRSRTVATTTLPAFSTDHEALDLESRAESVREIARSPAPVDDPYRAATAAPSLAAALATFAPWRKTVA
jgi:hypothetical protein